MGGITEISDEFDCTYLRGAKDFVTGKWHTFPVGNRGTWEKMKKRFDPRTPGRYPDDFRERCEDLARVTVLSTLPSTDHSDNSGNDVGWRIYVY